MTTLFLQLGSFLLFYITWKYHNKLLRKRGLIALLGLIAAVGIAGCTSPTTSSQTQVSSTLDYTEMGLLTPNGEKQLVLQPLDSLSRAQGAHIQLQDKDEPTKKRDAKLNYNPVGWHNYQLPYGDGSKSAWLMSRGHLVGYQFSGLNDEPKNLVPMTTWLNAGNYVGTDDSNVDSMLYYENRLDSWLATHPNFWLDYKVTPIYTGEELLPRSIQLQYVGIDQNGDLLEITLGGKESKDQYGITHVTLDNVSPNATIDYATGMASQSDASTQEATPQSETTVAPQTEAATTQAAPETSTTQNEPSTTAPAATQNTGGYYKDKNGRWHRPNGQFAKKQEIKDAGLEW